MKKLLAILTVTVSGAAFATSAQAVDEIFETESGPIQVTTFADGLANPWAIEFMADGSALVTERSGNLRMVSLDGTVSEPIEGLPEIDVGGQGGLLDVALAPDFDESRTIYFTFSEPGEGGNSTAMAMAVLSEDGASLTDVETIFSQQPKYDGDKHFGSRILFDDEGHVFLGLGERSDEPIRDGAQDLDNHLGKVVRLNLDGSVPEDNPFVDQEGALPEIYTYGNRNIQGGAVNPETGEIWFTEHGPKGGDELNLIEAGNNYGWPIVSYGTGYDGTPLGDGEATVEGFTDPVHYWNPVTGASGLHFYTGDLFPDWQGKALSGGLVTTDIAILTIEGGEVTGEEHILADLGLRIRDVTEGPDGAVYAITDESAGEILRIAPADGEDAS